MMLVIAIAAVTASAIVCTFLRAHYLQRAENCDVLSRLLSMDYEQDVPAPKMTNYYLELKHKYERAARYPWLPVAPDPPPPK